MRIYRVNIEHKRYGRNYDVVVIAGRTFNEAIRKVKSQLRSEERIESVELKAATD
jgi:hypothetical protein